MLREPKSLQMPTGEATAPATKTMPGKRYSCGSGKWDFMSCRSAPTTELQGTLLSSSVHYATELDPTYFVKTAKCLSYTQVLDNIKNKVRHLKNLAAKCKGLEAPKEFTLKMALLDKSS